MRQVTVNFRGTRQEAIDAIERAVAGMTGGGTPNSEVGRLLARVGAAVLAKVTNAFKVKSRGGTDECGLKWRRLSQATLDDRKRRTARRKAVARYWGRDDILRDTSELLDSLDAGAHPSQMSAGHHPGPDQVFKVGNNEVEVGTAVDYAVLHHQGRGRRPPKRRLWPEPRRWTSRWWREILHEAAMGVTGVLVEELA